MFKSNSTKTVVVFIALVVLIGCADSIVDFIVPCNPAAPACSSATK